MTQFTHQHAAHCESGVIANLMTYSGQPISEAMAFGLSSGLSFAYLPFIKISGAPLIAYRMPPKSIIKGVTKSLRAHASFKTFRSPQAGQVALDEMLAKGQVAGLQASVYWLPYFPEDMRFHFNAHNLVVFGKEGNDYLVSDPVFEETVRCSVEAMNRARFAKGMLAPKGLLYQLEGQADAVGAAAISKAIMKTCKTMQAPMPIAGIKGIRMLARKVAKLSPSDPKSLLFVGHIIRMQEEIGTGGAGFRFLYAAFLQEASAFNGLAVLAQHADALMAIGDEWRAFALKTARMVKGRETFVPAVLAACLHQLAEREQTFFKSLKQDVQYAAR